MQEPDNTLIQPTRIDVQHMDAVLRELGSQLKTIFAETSPIVSNEAMMATFKVIDGRAAEQIRTALAGRYPQIGWDDGELDGGQAESTKVNRYWVCDAVDGAVQFLRSIPHWCVTITLVEDGVATFTATYDANRDELFHAARGEGSFVNGEQIHVNHRENHRGALLANSQPPFINDKADVIDLAGRSLSLMLADAGAVRNLGPTSLQLAYVACGRLDGFWEFGEDTFNCIGGALLIEMAGGIATDVSGVAHGLLSQSIVAGPKGVHASMLERLSALTAAAPR